MGNNPQIKSINERALKFNEVIWSKIMEEEGWESELEELRTRETFVERMGGEEKVDRQRERGKLNIRERISKLLDKDSFHEIGKFQADPPMTMKEI